MVVKLSIDRLNSSMDLRRLELMTIGSKPKARSIELPFRTFFFLKKKNNIIDSNLQYIDRSEIQTVKNHT